MFTILWYALVIVAILLVAMYFSESFKDLVVSKGGAIGTALVALLAWVLSWFAGSPPEIPPM